MTGSTWGIEVIVKWILILTVIILTAWVSYALLWTPLKEAFGDNGAIVPNGPEVNPLSSSVCKVLETYWLKPEANPVTIAVSQIFIPEVEVSDYCMGNNKIFIKTLTNLGEEVSGANPTLDIIEKDGKFVTEHFSFFRHHNKPAKEYRIYFETYVCDNRGAGCKKSRQSGGIRVFND